MDHKIHIDAIRKGRDYGEVLDLYMESWEIAQREAESHSDDPETIFADTMALTAYAIYLMGVQDGMGVEIVPDQTGKPDFFSSIAQ